ncbi:hypothetical protein [Olleya sp. HaHaR_3_96]|nr:hypothetical protein [Olleya sp. HaHaR_3_96]
MQYYKEKFVETDDITQLIVMQAIKKNPKCSAAYSDNIIWKYRSY